jgi:hypothetical protein
MPKDNIQRAIDKAAQAGGQMARRYGMPFRSSSTTSSNTVDAQAAYESVLSLWGAVVDDRQREGLRVLAENIPGVKAVRDHLVWIEPSSGLVIEPPENAAKR